MHQDQGATEKKTSGPLHEIRRLRDEVRLDIHLASRDLQDQWRRLEKRLSPASRMAREIKGATGEALDSVTRELRALRTKLHERRRARPLLKRGDVTSE